MQQYPFCVWRQTPSNWKKCTEKKNLFYQTEAQSVCLLWRCLPFGFRFLWVNGEMPHGKLLVSYRVTRDNMNTSGMDHPRVKMFYIADSKTFLATTSWLWSLEARLWPAGAAVETSSVSLHLSCHLKLRLAAHGNYCKRSSTVKSDLAWNWGLTAELR